MIPSQRIRFGVTIFIVAQLVLSLLVPASTVAFAQADLSGTQARLERPSALATALATTLAVEILSTPWAVLDSNNPLDLNTPHVYLVQARVTNTGPEPATDVAVVLDYNPDQASNWILLPGESPRRTIDSLAAGASYNVYWFARYSSVIGATHLYSVSASADNAAPVSTSTNVYENPDGATIKTRSTLSTGNSGLTQVSANIVVGVAFTVTIGYDLGSNPQGLTFSPVGNTDFNPGSYRLLSSSVRFYNDAGTWENTVHDQLYYPAGSLGSQAQNAQAIFTFIALRATDTRLCSYASVGYNSTIKYDQFYCSSTRGTTIPIHGDLSLTMSKQVNRATVLQGETLNYTIQYNNTGSLPLSYTWIWDDVASSLGSVLLDTVQPPYDTDASNTDRVAWYIGSLAAAGQAGSYGTQRFSFLVDGNGQDIADGTILNNLASFGINPGSLPETAAITSTTTTTIQAPVISFQTGDGQSVTQPGQSLTYVIQVGNTGSALATGLVVTDVLPDDVTLAGSPTPAPNITNGQTLVWNNLGDLAAGSGTQSISIPVTVKMKTPNGTVTQNNASLQYRNAANYVYTTKSAADQTTVGGPVLSISKSGTPGTVLTGKVITYTLAYANNGPAGATNVTITDQVPVNTTYLDCSGGTSCSQDGGVVTWNVDSVAAGASGSVVFTARAAADLATGSTIVNQTYSISSDQTDAVYGLPVITKVNREAAVIEGTVFNDADGDGVLDDGETGLNGVTVTLPGAVTPAVTTGADGKFNFRVETEGDVLLSTGNFGSYFRTTPPQVYLFAILGTTQTVNFGFSNSAVFGVVYGTVYHDRDANGLQSLGELGLAGVEVSSGSATPAAVTTNPYGQYTLKFTGSATATIVETNPPEYISTTPDSVSRSVATGSSNNSPLDFADFKGIKITGLVFQDTNVNGARDTGEGGLAGAVVSANDKHYTTTGDGLYTLYVTLAGGGAVQISEADPAGYISTNALPGAGMKRVDATTLEISAPLLGTIYTDGNFGDAQASGVVTIQGQVWEDNGAGSGLANGAKDSDETGLAGAVVSLLGGLSTTTGAGGDFVLYAPPNQALSLSEKNPAGYVSTNAIPGPSASKVNNDQLQVSALSGGTTVSGNWFGDVLASDVAVISGTVFNDQNENGKLDSGEPGLSGVTVTVETPWDGSIQVSTDSNGAYEFAIRPGADLILRTSGAPGGYYPTTPTRIVTRLASGTYPGNNFGYSNDTHTAVITGWVFDDRNSNGEPDFGELGLAGVQIGVDDQPLITTSGNGVITGTFTFNVPAAEASAEIHHVYMINPPSYHSTTPDEINVSVVPGTYAYYVEFGDTDASIASVYGTTFDDLDVDGVQDANEPGLPGVLISVTVGGGSNVITATTKSYGQFSYGLDIYEGGYHTVSEQNPARPDYHSTTPDAVNVYVVLGHAYIVNFGDHNGGYVVMGTVYADGNDDGTQDAAEAGLPNVPIALSSGATTTTNPNGGYTLALADPDEIPYVVHVIETSDPTGYHSTTPNDVPLQVIGSQPVYSVDFGDSSNPYVSSIFGTVFHDQNVNAAYDYPVELGLSGITVTLTNDHVAAYVTNQWGQFTFRIETAGIYTITETDLAGWVSTAAIPGSAAASYIDNSALRVDVASLGSGLGGNLYGDARLSEVVAIDGAVWNDNGSGAGSVWADGVRNGSEPGLAGARVALSSGMYQVTGATGAFVLYGPPAQPLTLKETNPTGYLSTGAVPGGSAARVDRDTLAVSALSVGASSTGNLFGDVNSSSVTVIQGRVFNDADGNGVRGDSEAGIAGVTVKLDGTATRTTDATGFYEFITPVAGGHMVTETDPSGYFSTMPNSVFVDTLLGKTYTVDFGDALSTSNFAAIFGTVYDDLNKNAVRDAGEPGIPDVTLTLDGGLKVVTDIYGRYTFAVTTAGEHQVVETDPFYYTSTTPNIQAVTVVLGNGYQVDFGDLLLCSCTQDAYEVDNTAAQAAELLANNPHNCNFCTDAVDWTYFTAQAGAVYTITTSAVGVRADTYLELFDSDGTTLLAANDDFAGATDFSSRIVWEAPQAGKYYLRVSNRAMLTRCHTEYNINILEVVKPIQQIPTIYLPVVTRGTSARPGLSALRWPDAQGGATRSPLVPNGVISHACPDAYEVDDTWEQARSIESGVPQVHSFDSNPAQYAADKDLVSFQITAGDTVTFTTQLNGASTYLELFGANGSALNVTGENQLTWVAGLDGTYYLGVSPLNNVFGCENIAGYTLFYTRVEKVIPGKTIWLPVIQQ